MQQHTKVYCKYFKIVQVDWIPCEVCGNTAVDIHHIKPRSAFGSKMKGVYEGMQDHISNLIALCRKCHDSAHDNTYSRELLTEIHNEKIEKGQTI